MTMNLGAIPPIDLVMLALLAQFDADAQVAGKIETGAEFLRWRDETAVGERGAHTGVQKPARMSGVRNEAKARGDAQHRGVKVAADAAGRPAAGVEVPVAPHLGAPQAAAPVLPIQGGTQRPGTDVVGSPGGLQVHAPTWAGLGIGRLCGRLCARLRANQEGDEGEEGATSPRRPRVF